MPYRNRQTIIVYAGKGSKQSDCGVFADECFLKLQTIQIQILVS